MTRRLPSILSTILIAAALPAAAQQTYQPLTDGMTWNYVDGQGGERHVSVVGPTTIHGTPVVELKWVEPGQIYHNYWAVDSDGNVWLWAAWNEDGFALTYEPPFLWLQGVGVSNRCWESTARLFWGLDGSDPYGMEVTVAYCVTGGGPLDVPAGTFDTIRVEEADFAPPVLFGADRITPYAPDGRRLAADRSSDTRWYAPGIGLVADQDWQLSSSYGIEAAAEDATWGTVKALYR